MVMKTVEVVLTITDKEVAKEGRVFKEGMLPGGLFQKTLTYTVEESEINSFGFRKEIQDAKSDFLKEVLEVQAQITVKD